ncbi:hypothetical protein Tco_0925170 [Tanacetum coccineum]|uniref:Uncharacterized protein n=1 Tax=Tanacetum coccineum TaxID=301880 RepID=A0ABQ5D626_9ASTR
MPTTLGEAFSLSRITETHFEDDEGAHNFAQPNTGIGSDVVSDLPEEFQEGDIFDVLSRFVELKSSKNWKELDNESEDMKVERDAERECNGGVGYDDDGDGEVAVMVVLAAVEQQPERRGREKPRVKESDMGDRIDPLMRSIFGVRRKNPPEKFSGGRRWWPAAAGARRK